jgi:hypothetical protein
MEIKKNDEIKRVSVGEDDFILFTVKSSSLSFGFTRNNRVFYKLGKQFSPESAEIVRKLSPKYR